LDPDAGDFLHLDTLLRGKSADLAHWANITFQRGNLNENIAIRLILSYRRLNEGDDEGAADELAKAPRLAMAAQVKAR
jgi:hypothetical protein